MHPQFLFSQLILNLGVHAERARGHCTNNVMENVFPSLILVNGQWAELTPPPSSPFFVASILYTIYFLSGKPEWFLHLKLYSKMENLHLVTVALIVACVFFLKNTEFLEKNAFLAKLTRFGRGNKCLWLLQTVFHWTAEKNISYQVVTTKCYF